MGRQMSAATRPHVAPGDTVEPRDLTTITGHPIRLPAADGLTHLQFRRFAGCPICNRHLRAMAERRDDIRAAGIHQIVVFHSSATSMLPHHAALPFAAVADPDRLLYAAFSVGTSPRSLLSPRMWPTALRSMPGAARNTLAGRRVYPSRGESILGLPADVLIGPDARVRAAHYGRHAADQWSADDLLALAGRS
jgi:peroxiredoxin